jgi:hypothetical protein
MSTDDGEIILRLVAHFERTDNGREELKILSGCQVQEQSRVVAFSAVEYLNIPWSLLRPGAVTSNKTLIYSPRKIYKNTITHKNCCLMAGKTLLR